MQFIDVQVNHEDEEEIGEVASDLDQVADDKQFLSVIKSFFTTDSEDFSKNMLQRSPKHNKVRFVYHSQVKS